MARDVGQVGFKRYREEENEEQELALRELCRGVKRLNSVRHENAGAPQHGGSCEVETSHQKQASGEDSSDYTGQHVDDGRRDQSRFAGALPVGCGQDGIGYKEQQLINNRDSGLLPGWTNVYYIDSNRLLGDLHWEREHRQEQENSRG
eukprot:jgi/Picsp_1/755/NSC_04244-R1_---NA---